jgi:hypothetical protein
VKTGERIKCKGESSGGKSANTLLRVDRKDFSPERDKGQGTRDREIKTKENQAGTSLGSPLRGFTSKILKHFTANDSQDF